MVLTIDIGNTKTKIAVFGGEQGRILSEDHDQKLAEQCGPPFRGVGQGGTELRNAGGKDPVCFLGKILCVHHMAEFLRPVGKQ